MNSKPWSFVIKYAAFTSQVSNLAYLYIKEKNGKPCNIPSTQVHILLEFQTVQLHLHNRIKVSQICLLFQQSKQHNHTLTNEDIDTCHKYSYRDACQQNIVLLKRKKRNEN